MTQKQPINKIKQINGICDQKLKQFMSYIRLTIKYESVVPKINGLKYKSKKYFKEIVPQKSDKVIDNFDLAHPAQIHNIQLLSLPYSLPRINRILNQKSLKYYGCLRLSGRLDATELPNKKIMKVKACVRGYSLFLYQAQDIQKVGLLINGSIDINQQFFTINRLENKMGVMIYKSTQEGIKWQSFFLGLISLKAYYFLIAQGRGYIESTIIQFIQSQRCQQLKIQFKGQRHRQLIQISMHSYDVGMQIGRQFLENCLNLVRQKGCISIQLRDLPQSIKQGYSLPIQKFNNIQKLTLSNSINRAQLKTLQTFLRQNCSDKLIYLDISYNQLRGAVGKLFQVMCEKLIVQLQLSHQAPRQHMLLYYGLAGTQMDDSDLNKMIQCFDRINKKLHITSGFSYKKKCVLDLSRNGFQPKKLTFLSSFVANYHGIDRLVLRDFGCQINKIFFQQMQKNVGLRVLDIRENRIQTQPQLMHLLMNNQSLQQILITKCSDYAQQLLPYFNFQLI